MNGKIVLAIIAVCVFVIFLNRPTKKSSKLRSSAKVEFEPIGKEELNKNISNAKSSKYERKRQIALTEARLAQAQFKTDSGKVKFAFTPYKKTCQIGDIDIIRMDLLFARNKKILITVERLDQSSKSVFRKSITIPELYNGLKDSFQLPKLESDAIYGLFICSQHRDKQRCQDKKPADMAKINEDYLAFFERKISRPPLQEKIFYFQSMIYTKERLKIFSTKHTQGKGEKGVETILKARSIKGARRLAKKIALLNDNIYSVGARTSKDLISLSLPYNDPDSCGIIGFYE